MPWETLYLVCFILGLAFSLISVLGGSVHLHLPHGWWPHGGIGHGSGAGHGARGPLVNPLTVTAFLTWFGGTGYLLTQYTRLWAGMTLALTLLSGIAGAAVLSSYMLWLVSRERPLAPAAGRRVGTLGRLTSGIRTGGMGEMVFVQDGARRVCAAQSDEGVDIPRGAEVVIVRYARGIASVVPFEGSLDREGDDGDALDLGRVVHRRGAGPDGDHGPTLS
jgi:hypothetical protein